MTHPRSPAALPRRIPWLIGLAVGALSLAVAWVAAGIVPQDLMDPAPMPEAERLALTVLAVTVAALAILAGIAAFALESSLEPPFAEPPITARRPLPVAPTRHHARVGFREAA
ncbi:MAG: hypothetical protein K2X46_18910 [Roseomonas sp.]|nr:hypothetical protein [Roseomonas sp.]